MTSPQGPRSSWTSIIVKTVKKLTPYATKRATSHTKVFGTNKLQIVVGEPNIYSYIVLPCCVL